MPDRQLFTVLKNPKIMRKLKSIISIYFILIVGVNVAAAQQEYGTLKGSVADDLGSVANATITLRPIAKRGYHRNQDKITTTKSDGTFTFDSISFGTYKLNIENKCVTARKDEIEIKSSRTVNIEIKIGSEDCVQKEAQETAKWKTCELSDAKNNIELNDSDKRDIFRELLRNADEEYKIPDYDILVNQTAGIIMLAENADKEWLKQTPDSRITPLKLAEIKAFAKKRKEDILVLLYSSKSNGNCVKANIGTGWVIGKKSNRIYLSGGGCSYIFRKESGKWVGKQESCSIS